MKDTLPLKVMVSTREKRGTSLTRYQRHEWSVEGYVDEMVVGNCPLDTSDKVVLPKKFSRISPSKPRERRHKARLREGH